MSTPTASGSLTGLPKGPGSEIAEDLVLLYLVREPRVKPVKNKAVILLHGVGSNESDLFGLAHRLPDDFFVIAARAPFLLGAGRYAWYNVDFSTGRPVFDVQQEASSRQIIYEFVVQVKQKYQLEEVYIGGFSQGAIMSYSVGLMNPNEVKGIISFGGRLLEEIRPLVKKGDDLGNIRVFIAHGVMDNTLPVHYAREAKAWLEKLPVELRYNEYPVGHQISEAGLIDLNRWLTSH